VSVCHGTPLSVCLSDCRLVPLLGRLPLHVGKGGGGICTRGKKHCTLGSQGLTCRHACRLGRRHFPTRRPTLRQWTPRAWTTTTWGSRKSCSTSRTPKACGASARQASPCGCADLSVHSRKLRAPPACLCRPKRLGGMGQFQFVCRAVDACPCMMQWLLVLCRM
jgi:hypothetical protein